LFTGLIEDTGRVIGSGGNRVVLGSELLEGIRCGDSVSVDGVCLTVSEIPDQGKAVFHYSGETGSRSLVSGYTVGSTVNLELPLKASDRLHGHLVTGHVDCTATVTGTAPSGSDRQVWVDFHRRFRGLVVEKGSVAVNGISLTVASLRGDSFAVMIIPETLDRTNAGSWKPGTGVNLEFDIIGKYVSRFLGIDREDSRLRSFLEESSGY
jgi:riboflavin synthase